MTLPAIEWLETMLVTASKGRRVQFHPKCCDEAKGSHHADWDNSHETSLIMADGTRYRGYSSHRHSRDAELDGYAFDLAQKVIADAARIEELEGFIRDFATATFDALPCAFIADPQDRPDDATDLAAVLAWQDDARELLKEAKP